MKHIHIGKGVKIWKFCNIYGTADSTVSIGDLTQIGSFTEIKPGVVIGKSCRIQSFVFIGDQTLIEDDVFIGPGVKILNDKYPTVAKTLKKTWKCLPVKIRHHAVIGGGAVIGPGITVGPHAIVGMGAVVTKDVNDYEIVAGNPAKVIGYTTKKSHSGK